MPPLPRNTSNMGDLVATRRRARDCDGEGSTVALHFANQRVPTGVVYKSKWRRLVRAAAIGEASSHASEDPKNARRSHEVTDQGDAGSHGEGRHGRWVPDSAGNRRQKLVRDS